MTENERNMLLDYEQLLLNHSSKKISTSYFEHSNSEEMAKTLFRYIFEKILRWSPEDIYNYTTPEIIRKLHLVLPYSKLKFHKELVKNRDTFYIASILYPDMLVYERQCFIVLIYRNVLERKEEKYPKDFFEDEWGFARARLCLQYMLAELQKKENYFDTLEDLYQYFSDTEKATQFLKRCKLLTALNLLYESPLDYLHDSLVENQKDEFMYQFYKFKQVAAQANLHEQIKELYTIEN